MLELTTGTSANATEYTYALYTRQAFLLSEERIGPTYDMILHMHVHG
jgi:hypothetical protein